MYNGQHALVVYDDLSKQAAAYREMSSGLIVNNQGTFIMFPPLRGSASDALGGGS